MDHQKNMDFNEICWKLPVSSNSFQKKKDSNNIYMMGTANNMARQQLYHLSNIFKFVTLIIIYKVNIKNLHFSDTLY